MTWTKERPTRVGWYWYRGPETLNYPVSYPDGYAAVEVDGGPAYGMNFFTQTLDQESGQDVANMIGEWQGPITPD